MPATKKKTPAVRPQTVKQRVNGATDNPALRGPILLATRGSGDSKSAALVAQLIAARVKRDLRVISVVEPVLLAGLPTELQEAAVVLDRESLSAREKDIRSADFRQQLLPGVKWNSEVRLGQPAGEICDVAGSMDATVIVVGASPHRRMRRIIAGQRAAQILHRSTSPVLSVAPWLKSLPRKVVVGIDFNAASMRAAEAALLMLEKGGLMTLVHVMPPTFIFPSPEVADVSMRLAVKRELDKVARILRPRAGEGITIDTVLLDGEAAPQLLDFADDSGADLIAVGTQGGSAIRRAIVGSVASEVFHTALCSVLASPPGVGAAQMYVDRELRGTAVATEVRDFPAVLDSFSSRNSGRRVLLEEDDSILGAQVQVHGYTLRGAVYDRADRRVDLMLSAPEGETGQSAGARAHLTRSIPDVVSLAVTVDRNGNDRAMQIRHGKSQTLVLINGTDAGD
jgi:nucleotide-binding universal stress UspA family protein